MDKIYLIEKTWIDELDNQKPWGYSPIGFVKTLTEAKRIVNGGGKHNIDDCWLFSVTSASGNLKELPTIYRYKEIKNIQDLIGDKEEKKINKRLRSSERRNNKIEELKYWVNRQSTDGRLDDIYISNVERLCFDLNIEVDDAYKEYEGENSLWTEQ